jgi:surfeit locus 1 family protein
MPIPRYRFRPALLPTLAALVLLPLMLWMGYWQLDRAEQKRALQAEYDARIDATPVSLGRERWSAEDVRFRRVELKGYYETAHQILLDNRVHQGAVGYHVITPLHIAGSDMRVLVNRGWVPMGRDREHLPPIETPADEQKILGVTMVPSDHYFTLASPGPVTGPWQTVWQNMDMPRYAQAVPFPVQPVVVLLDATSSAGGFVREWARLDAGIATHQSYAFQWFSLAVAVLGVYLLVNTERATTRQDGSGDNQEGGKE